IECPGRIWEILYGWEYHRWYVEVQEDQLIFEEKARPLHDPTLHEWTSHLFKTDRRFEQFILENSENYKFMATYDWRGQIECTVRRSNGKIWERAAAKLSTQGPITRADLSAQLKR